MNNTRKRSISIKEIVETMKKSKPLTLPMIKKILLNGTAGPIILLRHYVPSVHLLCNICLDKTINKETKQILIEKEMFDNVLNIIDSEELKSIIEDDEIEKIMKHIHTSRTFGTKFNEPPPPKQLTKQNSVSNSLLTEMNNPANIRRMNDIMEELSVTKPFKKYDISSIGISGAKTLHYTWSINGEEEFHLSLKPKPNSKSNRTKKVSKFSKNTIGSLHVKFVKNPEKNRYKRISITMDKDEKYVIRLISYPKLNSEQNEIMDGICEAIVKYYTNAIYEH